MNFKSIVYGLLFVLTTCDGNDPLERICVDLEESGDVWNLISRADPKTDALNIAFPDFAAEYWVTCFPKNSRPLFWGTFPDWAYYSALTAYDTSGIEIEGATVESKYHNDTSKPIDLLENINTDSSSIAVLFRIYSPYNVTDDSYRRINTRSTNDERFRIENNGVISKSASFSTAVENANRVGRHIKLIISFIIPRVDPKHFRGQFRYINTDGIGGLFPNANAMYLMAFTTKHYFRNTLPVVRLDGLCQPPNDHLYYYDIMAVNQDTTETDDSISFEQLGIDDMCVENEPYVVIIAKQWKNEYSKIPNLRFIQWNRDNSFPSIVIRYLIDLKSEKGEELVKILETIDGETYENKAGVPKIQYLHDN
jgi:hypothetical protein